MANNVYSWSQTASSNTSLDGLTWAELMQAGQVNNSARQMMASLRAFVADLAGATQAGGTANALTLTSNAGIDSLTDGRVVAFTATATNTGSATLNVNVLGTKSIRKFTDSGESDLVGGEIQSGNIYVARYSAAADTASGGWILENPTATQLDATLLALAALDSAPGMLRQTGADTFDKVAISDFQWLSKAIGEPFPLLTNLTGVSAPPTDSSLYRFIELTAGLTGSGAYNEGCLTSESTSGSAPLVLSAASVSLSSSPMLGATVRLMNTEERFLRAAASPGTAQQDAMQGHRHNRYSSAATFVTFNEAGGGASLGSGSSGIFRTVTTTGDPITDDVNGTPRTASETRAKNLGAKYFMRIL